MDDIDQRSKIFREYHKFNNVMAYRFREMTKTELKFLAENILGMNPRDGLKAKLVPEAISEVYKVLLAKEEKNELFWQVANFLCSHLTIVITDEPYDSMFKSLNIKSIEIYHSQKPPVEQFSDGQFKSGICRDGVLCICQEDNPKIRKTNVCYNCGIEVHKRCFPWKDDLFVCANCILDNYDPFYTGISKVYEPQIMQTNTILQFYLKENDFFDDLALVVKCIRVNPELDCKYNDMEMNFPQKSTVKINGIKAREFKPDRPTMPKRRDLPIVLPLFPKKNILKRGFNTFVCEFDPEAEEETKGIYIFNIKICKQRSPMEIIEAMIEEQSKDEEKAVEKARGFLHHSFNDLSSVEIKIALTCPLTFKTIKVPVKGENCSHLNVFCLETFLKNLENSENRKAKCPLCGKTILKFKIDFLILDVLFQYLDLKQKYSIESEVTFKADFTCYFIEQPPEAQNDDEQSVKSRYQKKEAAEGNTSIDNSNKNRSARSPNSVSKSHSTSRYRSSSESSIDESSDDNFSISSDREEYGRGGYFGRRGRRRRQMRPRIDPTNDRSIRIEAIKPNEPRREQKPKQIRGRQIEHPRYIPRQEYLENERRFNGRLTFMDEEVKIIELLKPFHDSTLSPRALLDMFNEEVGLIKRIERDHNFEYENLKRVCV